MKTIITLYALCISLCIHAQDVFPLGLGLNGNVHVIQTYFNSVYVGGEFTDAGGNPDADYLAVWNGESWEAVLPGLNGPVYSLISTYNGMYIGGAFTAPYQYLALFDYDWLAWFNLGDSLLGPVKQLAQDYSQDYSVYVAGEFEQRLLRWTSYTWTPLGAGVTGEINVLQSRNNELYVGGKFRPLNASTCVFNIYRNHEWVNMVQPIDIQHVYDLALYEQDVYLCGYPTTFCEGGMGGIHEPIMRWDKTSYHTLGHFGGCRVASNLCIQGNSLYVDALDPLGEEAIFRWNLQTLNWNGFLTYFQEEVFEDQIQCMASNGNQVFLGGKFTNFESAYGDHIVGVTSETTANQDPEDPVSLTFLPQPAHDYIELNVAGTGSEPLEINIYDLQGRKRIHTLTTNRQLDIQELPSGFYLMELRLGNSRLTAKLIKQ